ncbi:MAG: AIPR family protein [Fibrobacterales bacterium]|nr:AIPR family protein [Fibrobacterales bacterium]
MTFEEYYTDFKQELLADSEEDFVSDSFVEKMCAVIAEQGAIDEAELVGYKFTQRGIAVDAIARDPERNRCTLIIADFRNSDEAETITKTDIEKSLKRLDRFVEICGKDDFVDGLEESDPVFPFAKYIRENKELLQFDFILVTDAKMSGRVKEMTPAEYGIKFAKRCDLWDIQRLFELETSGLERETLEVDFTQYSPQGISCLSASTGADSLQSFLFVLPGSILADLYEKYGERLFEQNVRTFLQFRGKVNKGIRNTIVHQPEMFFSYNNGISATGEAVVLDKSRNRIKKIRNLQIVNGGQTTASIYATWHKENAPLDNVFVQVKLSVIESDVINEIVPKISEYANTQNKVNAADFFSNHPFHLRIEEFSRRLWAPASDGSPRQTHWFYERARGQYVNAQTKLSKSEASRFLSLNPKEQMFTKTDLAKYYLTFKEMPAIVCLGAQKAFAGTSGGRKGFVSIITEEWEKNKGNDGNNTSINEKWYKDAIAQAILFRSLNKSLVGMLREVDFGSFRSVIVPYTLARFVHEIGKSDSCLDYGAIWQRQKAPAPVMENLLEVARVIIKYFKDSQTSVSELAKREVCWQQIRELPIRLSSSLEPCLRNKNDVADENRYAKKAQREMNDIQALQYVVEKPESHWLKLKAWDEEKHFLSSKERSILGIACRISKGMMPSDAQAKVLVAAEKLAIEEGFYDD